MINQNAAIAYVPAPQDVEIARLGAALNQTYVRYGAGGKAKLERQAAQDGLASLSGMGTAVSRSVSKSSGHYDNSEWDLVDAAKRGRIAPAAVPAAALPPEMQAMKPAEREAFVAEKAKERAELQKKIVELNSDREKFLSGERAKSAGGADRTLDDAMMESVRKEAAKKSISL
jgi:hypothetical protein